MDSYYDIFENIEKLFGEKYKSVDEIKDNCIYILDTNILLLPYKNRNSKGNADFKEIVRVYEKLTDEKRLLVPVQVIKEFMKNRPTLLSNINSEMINYKSSISENKFKTLPIYAVLSGCENYELAIKKCEEIKENIDKNIKEYKKYIDEILEYIKHYNWNDKISNSYWKLFKDSIIHENRDYDKVKKEFQDRCKFKIPPALEDEKNKDDGIGDYLIWKDILDISKQEKKDVLFVTLDEKSDWYHKSNKNKLYPRIELLYEFKSYTNGQDIYFIDLSTMIQINSGDKEVVENIKNLESEVTEIIDKENIELDYHKSIKKGLKIKLNEEYRICARCGNQVPESLTYCNCCGYNMLCCD